MDEQRFDDLARRWSRADGARSTRRAALGRTATLLAAATPVGLLTGRRAADAAGAATCRAAQPITFISKQACQVLPCGSTPGCLCVQTLGHRAECVAGFDPANRNDCPRDDECNDRRPCRNGFVCAKVLRCCGKPHRRCLRRCPA